MKRLFRSDPGFIVEGGILLFVAAATISIALAIDTKLVKESQIAAAKAVDQICSHAALNLPITKSVVNASAQLLIQIDTEPNLDGIQLTNFSSIKQFRVISPTLIDDVESGEPFITGDPASLPEPIPEGLSNIEFYFGGDIREGYTSVSQQYPSTLWEGTHGEHVACEVTATVKTIISGTRTAFAKAVHRLQPQDPQHVGGQRGITIGIAPYAEISDSSRFQFQDQPDYDPLLKESGNLVNQAFSAARTESSHPLASQPYFALDFTGKTLASTNPLADSDRTVMLRRCYNPYVAVRNSLLQYLVTRMSRLSSTRSTSELLIINPRHPSNPGTPNPLTKLVGFGEDLDQPLYELPFINYQLPQVTDPKSHDKGVGAPATHTLCPFTGCSDQVAGLTDETERHHMLVASQLRDCYLVHNSDNGILTFEDQSAFNDGYEPFGFSNDPLAVPAYDPLSGIDSGDWSQDGSAAQGLSAEELVRMLGVAEDCPYNWGSTDGLGKSCNNILWKNGPIDPPDQNPEGLSGDIMSFVDYLTAGGTFYPAPGPLEVPGSGKLLPEAISSHSPPLNHVLLVLSKRLDSEINLITNKVDQIENIKASMEDFVGSDRSITVIYIPTDDQDANTLAFDNLEEAFRVGEAGINSQVIMLAPCAAQIVADDGTLAACQSSAPEDIRYSEYWDSLLDPVVEQNIWRIAQSIFQKRLMEKKVVL